MQHGSTDLIAKGCAVLQALIGIRLLSALINILEIFMFARAVISWIPFDEESRLEEFLITVTEPFITPMRFLLDRFDAIRTMPLDVPFFATMLLLSVISMVVGSFI